MLGDQCVDGRDTGNVDNDDLRTGSDHRFQKALHDDLRPGAVQGADQRQRHDPVPQLDDRGRQFQHLLLLALLVVLVALLDRLHLRLDSLHLRHRGELLLCDGKQQAADDHRHQDDRNTEIADQPIEITQQPEERLFEDLEPAPADREAEILDPEILCIFVEQGAFLRADKQARLLRKRLARRQRLGIVDEIGAERRIAERTRTVNMLNEALESHGEQPIDDASATTQGQQLLQSIRDAFADKDEAAVERIEAIESDLSERYADALRHDDMDASIRMTITSAAREVREGERFSKVLERHYV